MAGAARAAVGGVGDGDSALFRLVHPAGARRHAARLTHGNRLLPVSRLAETEDDEGKRHHYFYC